MEYHYNISIHVKLKFKALVQARGYLCNVKYHECWKKYVKVKYIKRIRICAANVIGKYQTLR